MPRIREKHSVSHSRNACRTVSVSLWEWKRCPRLLQFPAQFQVIVDLAVEDDDRVAILGIRMG